MGYVPKKKIYRLLFEDPEMEGLEVRMHGLNTGQWLDLVTKKEAVEEDAEDEAAVVELFQLMADRMASWNVTEEDGTPVPPTLHGIRQQDLAFNMAIVDAWQAVIAGVPAPLDSASPDGGPSLEASIPMEPLSLSPQPSAVPA